MRSFRLAAMREASLKSTPSLRTAGRGAGGELRPLVDFLGLPWDEQMLAHTETAKKRGAIITPSYDQVTEPLSRARSADGNDTESSSSRCFRCFCRGPKSWVIGTNAGAFEAHARCADYCSDRALRREARRPEVENQHDAKLSAVIPGLMLDGIVEDEGLADIPLPGGRADPETANRRNDKRQVADEPGIGDPSVRRNARARRKQREHRIGRSAADVRLRKPNGAIVAGQWPAFARTGSPF